jgi:hypothetical protein
VGSAAGRRGRGRSSSRWGWLKGGLFVWDADVEENGWIRIRVRWLAHIDDACGAGSFRRP